MMHYDQISGKSMRRIESIGDGIFAIALTLLILEIKLPDVAPQGELHLLLALGAVLPKVLIYFLSFLTLGIYWIAHSTQCHYIGRSDRNHHWINLFYFLSVSMIPLSSEILGSYMQFKIAVFIYWLNLMAMGGVLALNWRYALKASLIQLPPDELAAVSGAIKRRILMAHVLYTLSLLLCLVSPYASVAALVAVQLNIVFAFVPSRGSGR